MSDSANTPKQVTGMNKFFTGLLVIVFYIIFLSSVFIGFSAYSSRVNLGNELAAEVGSLDTLIFRTKRIAEIESIIEKQNDQLQLLESKLTAQELTRSKTDGNISIIKSQQIAIFIPIATMITQNTDIIFKEYIDSFNELHRAENLIFSVKIDRLVKKLATVEFADNSTTNHREDLTNFITKKLSELSILRNNERELLQINKESELNIAKIVDKKEFLKLNNKKNNSNLSNLSNKLKDEHQAIISSFENSLAGIPYAFIQIPTIILTLIVTIATGGLGSIVAFTRKFLRGHEGTGTLRLTVNVGEGVAAAVAIFLFVGAGMLMLTQGSTGSAGQVELSPYMVAFIAFLSGFMAEEAFVRIQFSGTEMFKVDRQGDDQKPPTINAQINTKQLQTERPGGKTGQVLEAIEKTSGASLKDLIAETGMTSNSVKSAITRLQNRGLNIHRETADGQDIYTLVSPDV